MKALTIVQPYAALICLPDDEEWAKRVENRTWGTHYRGPLLIHAGKSRERLDEIDEYPALHGAEIVFGAVVAVARMAGCFLMDGVEFGAKRKDWTVPRVASQRFPWLPTHLHVEGPYCWVLTEVRPLSPPICCPGAQGLWTPSDRIIESVRTELLAQK